MVKEVEILNLCFNGNSPKNTNGINCLAIDTDGIDGIEDNAGAYISEETLKKASMKK